jgi:menaquinone-dependent protoporphyrinogen IX oxidase
MKTVIIYKGKYGATRQYGEWLSEELHAPVVSTEDYKESELLASDIVVLGSSVYIGQLQIKQWLKEHEQLLLNKKVFLFVVCGTPPEEREKLQPYINSSVPSSILKHMHVYFLHGRLIYKKLSRMDKFMLRMGAMLTRDKKTRKTMLSDYDDVKKMSLIPLITDVRKIAQQSGVVYPE